MNKKVVNSHGSSGIFCQSVLWIFLSIIKDPTFAFKFLRKTVSIANCCKYSSDRKVYFVQIARYMQDLVDII